MLAAAAALIAGAWILEAAVKPGFERHATAVAARIAGAVLVIPGAIKVAFGYWKARDAAGSDLTFLVLGARFQHARYTACPPCTRATIEEHLLRNLVSANLLWVAPAIQGLAALAHSFTRGHSREIQRALEQQRPPQTARVGA